MKKEEWGGVVSQKQKALTQQLAELRKKIEEMRKESTCDCGGSKKKHEVIGCNGNLNFTIYEDGYNQALSDILDLKDKEK